MNSIGHVSDVVFLWKIPRKQTREHFLTYVTVQLTDSIDFLGQSARQDTHGKLTSVAGSIDLAETKEMLPVDFQPIRHIAQIDSYQGFIEHIVSGRNRGMCGEQGR